MPRLCARYEDIDEYNQRPSIEKQLKEQAFEEDETNIIMMKGFLRKGFNSATREL